jgi:ubiquinone/menaquinone biosynthesis C-methylase UbiE
MAWSLFRKKKRRSKSLAQAPITTPAGARPEIPPLPEGLIDVRKLIARYDVAEHASKADDYFKSFTLQNAEFRKPFMDFDASHTVTNLGIVLGNLDFFPGMRVVDFGCGTAWLAQCLALMRCRPVAVDVSRRALALGEEATRARYPEVIDQISYLPYDGMHIDLPDGSMDRVICFDCFHHVANQDQLLREFHRILAPDGSAVFCEPGPLHSRTEESQYAMRHFDVIENDILIDEVWDKARTAGFTDLKLTVWNGRSQQISLDELASLRTFESAAPVLRKAYDEIYGPLYNGNRHFVLFKGPDIPDSRRRHGLSVDLSISVETIGDTYRITGTARNTGVAVWRPSGPEAGGVNVGLFLKVADDTAMIDFDRVYFLDRRIAPGEEAPFQVDIARSRVGTHQLYADLVAEQVAWFSGDQAVRIL